jgi:hypothetical protein
MALGVKDDRGWIGPGGTVGDATKATAKKGNRILDNYATLVAGHIKKWVIESPIGIPQEKTTRRFTHRDVTVPRKSRRARGA